METTIKDFEDLVRKVEESQKGSGADISSVEDLSLAVMNLISLEEHLFFTGAKTKDGSYHDLSQEVREMRKAFMKKLVDEHEGETWCATKHLLSGTMRLVEVGNRYQAEGKKDEARGYFEGAYKLYSVFWALRLKLIGANRLPESANKEKMSLEDIVTKLADCCNE